MEQEKRRGEIFRKMSFHFDQQKSPKPRQTRTPHNAAPMETMTTNNLQSWWRKFLRSRPLTKPPCMGRGTAMWLRRTSLRKTPSAHGNVATPSRTWRQQMTTKKPLLSSQIQVMRLTPPAMPPSRKRCGSSSRRLDRQGVHPRQRRSGPIPQENGPSAAPRGHATTVRASAQPHQAHPATEL